MTPSKFVMILKIRDSTERLLVVPKIILQRLCSQSPIDHFKIVYYLALGTTHYGNWLYTTRIHKFHFYEHTHDTIKICNDFKNKRLN